MYKMPEEDPEIEFMDLDSENSEAAPRAPRGSFSPSKIRRSITIATIIGAITLCALMLNTVLHQPVPKPAPPVLSSNGPTQLSFIKDGTGYAIAQGGMIFAVRLRDGAVLWHYNIRKSIQASIVDNIVYVIYFDGSMDTFSLNPTSFTHLWHYRLPGRPTQPLIAVNGLTVVTQDKTIYAFRTSNGTLLWQRAMTFPISLPPIAENGNIDIVMQDSNIPDLRATVTALHASDGAVLWQRSLAYISRSLIIADGQIYAIQIATIVALRASDGASLWSHRFFEPIYQTVPVAHGQLYVTTGGHVNRLQTTNGNILWQYQLPISVDLPPSVEGQTVYVESAKGSLYALQTTNGSLLWHSEPSQIDWWQATGDYVYVAKQDGTLDLLQAGTGSQFWHYQLPSATFGPLEVVNKTIYTGSYNGIVYAMPIGNNTLLWQTATSMVLP